LFGGIQIFICDKEEIVVIFQVKVRVNAAKMLEFGQMLQKNELDRSCIRGETHCLKNDPAVGYSIWETNSKDEFETKFGAWRKYYSEVDVREVITPLEAMTILFSQMKK
jgi:hypothetical protein